MRFALCIFDDVLFEYMSSRLRGQPRKTARCSQVWNRFG